jgi:hypothetical protein
VRPDYQPDRVFFPDNVNAKARHGGALLLQGPQPGALQRFTALKPSQRGGFALCSRLHALVGEHPVLATTCPPYETIAQNKRGRAALPRGPLVALVFTPS